MIYIFNLKQHLLLKYTFNKNITGQFIEERFLEEEGLYLKFKLYLKIMNAALRGMNLFKHYKDTTALIILIITFSYLRVIFSSIQYL